MYKYLKLLRALHVRGIKVNELLDDQVNNGISTLEENKK
ncbi:hypothetical protein EMIT079MI2_310020 [Bacillus sp. IT-79MI2]